MISPVKVWRKQKQIRGRLGKMGKIVSWTKISTAGLEFVHQAPYFVGLVQLESNEMVVGQITDCDQSQIKIGAPVICLLRKTKYSQKNEILVYDVKFKIIKSR